MCFRTVYRGGAIFIGCRSACGGSVAYRAGVAYRGGRLDITLQRSSAIGDAGIRIRDCRRKKKNTPESEEHIRGTPSGLLGPVVARKISRGAMRYRGEGIRA